MSYFITESFQQAQQNYDNAYDDRFDYDDFDEEQEQEEL